MRRGLMPHLLYVFLQLFLTLGELGGNESVGEITKLLREHTFHPRFGRRHADRALESEHPVPVAVRRSDGYSIHIEPHPKKRTAMPAVVLYVASLFAIIVFLVSFTCSVPIGLWIAA